MQKCFRGSSEDESGRDSENIDEDHGSSGRSEKSGLRMSAEETVHLEDQIDELEAAFPRAGTLFCTEDVSFPQDWILRGL